MHCYHTTSLFLPRDFAYATGHHDPLGVCGPIQNKAIMEGEGGVRGHMKRELEKTGELNNTPVTGSWMHWRKKNGLQNAIDNEPSFLKKHGAPEPLHLGGPGYGLDGLKKGDSAEVEGSSSPAQNVAQ